MTISTNNYILISNCPNLEETKINSINIKDNDTICLFNHARPFGFEKVKAHKTKYLFMNGSANSYHGLNQAITNKNFYHKMIVHMDEKNDFHEPKLIELQQHFKNIDTIRNFRQFLPEYTKGRHPTIGFLGYNYIRKICNIPVENIILVNFTGVKGKYHDADFEQQIYLKDNVLIL